MNAEYQFFANYDGRRRIQHLISCCASRSPANGRVSRCNRSETVEATYRRRRQSVRVETHYRAPLALCRRQLLGGAVAGQPPVFSTARHAEYRVYSRHRRISTAAARAESPRGGFSGVECPVVPKSFRAATLLFGSTPPLFKRREGRFGVSGASRLPARAKRRSSKQTIFEPQNRSARAKCE
jgi:hypothetical protein